MKMTRKKSRAWIGVLAVLLVAAIAVGALAWGSDWFRRSPSDWFKPDDPSGELPIEVTAVVNMDARVLSASNNGEEGEYICLKLYPPRATDKTVTWSFSWADPASAWATDKQPMDYVTYRDAGNLTWPGEPAIFVTAKQGFSEPIVATAVSNDNASATFACRIGYYNELIGFDGSLLGADLCDGDNGVVTVATRSKEYGKYVGAGVRYSDIGTKQELGRAATLEIELDPQFLLYLDDEGIEGGWVDRVEVGATTLTFDRILDNFFAPEDLQDGARYNTILDCLDSAGGVFATLTRTVYGKRGVVTGTLKLKLDPSAYNYKVTGFDTTESDAEIWL